MHGTAPLEMNTAPLVNLEADCDLSFLCEGRSCQPLHEGGFAKMWSGGRANFGLRGTEGRFMFEVRVLRELPVSLIDVGNSSPGNVHLCRVGWSCSDTPTHALGETASSWGFGGSARKSHSAKFEPFGEPYGVGDTITCGFDLSTNEICFAKNGSALGRAYTVDSAVASRGLYPHVLLKNVQVEIAFDSRLSTGLPDFAMVASAVGGPNVTPCTELEEQPEVIMLVGLPAAGKTTWASAYTVRHPQKRYCVLSTNDIMNQMRVSGLQRAHNYRERFEALMPEATAVLNKLLELAPSRRRNYLWDQTNVYPSARKRKLTAFRAFRKVAAVLVCSSETLQARARAREQAEGKVVPEEAVQEMKKNCVLPTVAGAEGFSEIWFVGELDGTSAFEQVESDRREADAWLVMQRKRKEIMPSPNFHPSIVGGIRPEVWAGHAAVAAPSSLYPHTMPASGPYGSAVLSSWPPQTQNFMHPFMQYGGSGTAGPGLRMQQPPQPAQSQSMGGQMGYGMQQQPMMGQMRMMHAPQFGMARPGMLPQVSCTAAPQRVSNLPAADFVWFCGSRA